METVDPRPAAALTCAERDRLHREARRPDPVCDDPLPLLMELAGDAPRADPERTTMMRDPDRRGRLLTSQREVVEYVVATAPSVRIVFEGEVGWIVTFDGAWLPILRERLGWGSFQDAGLDV